MSDLDEDIQAFLAAINSLTGRLEPPRRPQDAGMKECSPRELRVLQALGEGPLPMSDLVEILEVPHSTVTRTVDKLEAKGLVERRQSREDRRVFEAGYTTMGKQIYRYIDRSRKAQARSMMGSLSDNERRRFIRQLRKLLDG